MHHYFRARFMPALLLLFALTANSHAGVVIGGTRIVFPAAQGEVTVRLMNQGKSAALVQAWIDTGDLQSTPDNVQTPFLITPPLFRMNAGRDQSLRILALDDGPALPTDRESLFWLNVLEVPPMPTGNAADQNMLRFAVRSRLKLFYRPDGLAGSSARAPEKLIFTLQKHADGSAIRVENPTPYYITIAKLAVTSHGAAFPAESGMVAPFATRDLPLKGAPSASGADVTYTTINDFGGDNEHHGVITQ